VLVLVLVLVLVRRGRILVVGGSSTSLDGAIRLPLAGDRSQAAAGNLSSEAIWACERVVALRCSWRKLVEHRS
jgi:hypothetical protein